VSRFLEPLTRIPAAPLPAAAPKMLAAGTRVTHTKFGAGAVVRVSGDKVTREVRRRGRREDAARASARV
jgi:hypothetical protein